jgi:hypothetical protein
MKYKIQVDKTPQLISLDHSYGTTLEDRLPTQQKVGMDMVGFGGLVEREIRIMRKVRGNRK